MLTRACLIVVVLFAPSLGVIDTVLAQTAAPAAVPVPSCDKPGALDEYNKAIKTYNDAQTARQQ